MKIKSLTILLTILSIGQTYAGFRGKTSSYLSQDWFIGEKPLPHIVYPPPINLRQDMPIERVKPRPLDTKLKVEMVKQQMMKQQWNDTREEIQELRKYFKRRLPQSVLRKLSRLQVLEQKMEELHQRVR